ncbi:MAG TPA: hypothetical protein VM328_12750 [Fimbriimonadaceae bacterium]|nr:hypothetical protein [Fimbriimonadaceae bacterium]
MTDRPKLVEVPVVRLGLRENARRALIDPTDPEIRRVVLAALPEEVPDGFYEAAGPWYDADLDEGWRWLREELT